MQAFRYDKTFEGLLTAVFDAYVRRTFPDRLLERGEPEPMFMQGLHPVITDPVKAARVWAGLRKKLPHRACNMLLHVWLSEEPGSDELLLRYIRKVFDAPYAVARDFTDDDVLQVSKIALRVSREREHLVQFLRFQKAADGTYFAPVSPASNVLPLAAAHLRDRFADQKWMVYDLKRKYGCYYDLHTVSEIVLDEEPRLTGGRLDEQLLAGDELLFQQLWKAYFKALAIRERIRPKLQRQHMPRRFWKYLTEMQ